MPWVYGIPDIPVFMKNQQMSNHNIVRVRMHYCGFFAATTPHLPVASQDVASTRLKFSYLGFRTCAQRI